MLSSSARSTSDLKAGDHDGLEEGLFGREVPVDRPDADTGPRGHRVDGHGQALGCEDLFGGFQYLGPVAAGRQLAAAGGARPSGQKCALAPPGPLLALSSMSPLSPFMKFA